MSCAQAYGRQACNVQNVSSKVETTLVAYNFNSATQHRSNQTSNPSIANALVDLILCEAKDYSRLEQRRRFKSVFILGISGGKFPPPKISKSPPPKKIQDPESLTSLVS